ncbi:OmpA family protein [Mesorhizobium sp. M5C.F.Ca.ET.164.01.1.1]|uniref:OmpA family protein n=1 Tax=Mesorhizobium sp. M5C.F.Ca.ET.164.01.1.1 TaxID=2563957 RepID=UPI00109409DE|nr:OmpA family protein [Mesorhizobium sp. M5C.F.Ca.ET.164.01.1.1]TGU00646.1 flagellar motor protein MotB [Mesorhizobium sp. M5C.F.Ca.ET.164.01.1.1]
MKRHFRIVVGAAVGLTLTPAPLPALSRGAQPLAAPLILAQAQLPEEEELLRRKKRKGAKRDEQRTPRAERPAQRERAERPAAREREAVKRRAAEPEPAITEERQKRRKDREAVKRRAAGPDAPTIAEERQKRRKDREAVKRRAAEPDAPAIAEERQKRRKDREAARQRAAEPEPAITEERQKKRKEREAVKRRAAEPEPAITEERVKRRKEREAARQRAAEPEPAITEERLKRRKEREAAMRRPENAARLFDSAKEKPVRRKPGGAGPDQPAARARAERLPESDAAAQARASTDPVQIGSVISEEGRRIERPRRERPEVPEGAELVREVNNRFIFRTNNTYFIERPREERFIIDAREVYYEELPRSRQREVVVRPDGTRIVTIRNRWGDVVRRVKILPDDREIVLVYVEDDYYDEVLEWRDPGLDLPPLDLDIPVRDYILDAEWVEDPEDYYTFLDQPPVEQVERTYSLDEVRRSARIRDKVRRIDLDIINFEFGSAQIPESEIGKLEGVAEAMQRLLKENPGETFLIEGHTDAVGAEVANLALSDQRAEAVATALTNVFDIAPENMETQGYGEQYLKVETQEPERENRRVAIRRITPLVAPVASSE